MKKKKIEEQTESEPIKAELVNTTVDTVALKLPEDVELTRELGRSDWRSGKQYFQAATLNDIRDFYLAAYAKAEQVGDAGSIWIGKSGMTWQSVRNNDS